MTADRPFLGLLLMIGFCALAPLGDGIAKYLGQGLSVAVIVLARFLVQAVLLLPLALASGRGVVLRGRLLRLTVLRTVLHIVGIGAMFLALTYLPLADALAIAFVMPFMLLLLGHYVLREHVGSRRLMACIVGFSGTLLVIQPSFAEVGAPALLPLLVAVVFALFMLTTRQIAKQIDPITLQAVSGAIATALLIPALWLGAALPGMDLRWPTQEELWLLLLLGTLGTLAHLLMTWSLRFAPASTLAPVQYLEIPFATLIGWLMFRDLPGGIAALGIAITIASGLYVLFREQAMSRAAQPAP